MEISVPSEDLGGNKSDLVERGERRTASIGLSHEEGLFCHPNGFQLTAHFATAIILTIYFYK